MFGTLISVCNLVVRLPIRVPGHSSIYWMAILIVGKGLVPEFGSGLIMGVVSGFLGVIFGLGHEGPLLALKFIVPGVFLDLLSIIFFNQLESIPVAAIIGALISISKLMANMLLGMILNIPMVFLYMGFGVAMALHAVFGALGGVLAALILKRLKHRIEKKDSKYYNTE